MAFRFFGLALAARSLAQTVTITENIPFGGHDCIRECLFQPGILATDLGDKLECGDPYEEECYCPTAAPRAEIASRHIDDCAEDKCSAGDLSRDVQSMRSHYAVYCLDNGYTADLVEEWYRSAEEARSTESVVEATTTTATADDETETSSTEQTTFETEAAVSNTGSGPPVETDTDSDVDKDTNAVDDDRDDFGLDDIFDPLSGDDEEGRGRPMAGLHSGFGMLLAVLVSWFVPGVL